MLLGLLLGSNTRQVRLLLWCTRSVAVRHLMSTDERASTVMTSWLLICLRLCHGRSKRSGTRMHQAGAVRLL